MPRLLASADVLATGRAPDRPRLEVLAFAVADARAPRPRWRLELLVDRGDGQPERFALTLPADVVGLLGDALRQVAREADARRVGER